MFIVYVDNKLKIVQYVSILSSPISYMFQHDRLQIYNLKRKLYSIKKLLLKPQSMYGLQ